MAARFRATPIDEGTSRLGMVLFLASWAMLFGALFFAYGVLRLRMNVWPPPGSPPLPLVVPALNTTVLLVSSAALERAARLVRVNAPAQAQRSLRLALGLGVLFLGLQLELWWSLVRAGLAWGQGTIAGVVYGLTIFHAVHVLVGLAGLGALWAAHQARALPWRLWATYWHFVSGVWVVMFVLLFLL